MGAFIAFLVVGAVAGWLAGQLMKGGGFGLVGNIVVGMIGSMIGGNLFSVMGWSTDGGTIGAIVTALVGAVVLLLLIRVIKKA